jgi:hypothetical protein
MLYIGAEHFYRSAYSDWLHVLAPILMILSFVALFAAARNRLDCADQPMWKRMLIVAPYFLIGVIAGAIILNWEKIKSIYKDYVGLKT